MKSPSRDPSDFPFIASVSPKYLQPLLCQGIFVTPCHLPSCPLHSGHYL